MNPIRLCCTGDSHFNESNRLDDNLAVHLAMVEQAREVGVDLFLHGGDTFDKKSSPAERNAAIEFFRKACEVAPVHLVRGNHDADGDLDFLGKLRTECPLHLEQRVSATPGSSAIFVLRNCDAAVIGLSWFTKAHLVAAAGPEVDAATTTRDTAAAARALLTALRAEAAFSARHGAIPLLNAHVLIGGSETSTGQTLIGTTVELSPSDIAGIGCAHANLSHIHKAQAWHGGRVNYPGSPQRHNFGESEDKGWVYVEIDPERWREPGGVRWEFRPLPARRIVLLEADFSTAAPQFLPGISLPIDPATGGVCDDSEWLTGDLVRFRYWIRPQDLHLMNEPEIEAHLKACGAHDVKLEAILVHETRARCSEIVSAQTTAEKLIAFWDSKNLLEDDPHTRARVLDKLAWLENPSLSEGDAEAVRELMEGTREAS